MMTSVLGAYNMPVQKVTNRLYWCGISPLRDMTYVILAPLTILPTISYREPMQIDHEREHQEPDHSDKSGPFPIPATIPVFPLPNVVLFPKTYLPLHIFEPRYRQMVDDTVMGGQCIGMALLKEGWESDYYGNPPVFAMG